MKEQARAKARQLALEFVQRGDATGWFEELYTQAQGNEQAIHWADGWSISELETAESG